MITCNANEVDFVTHDLQFVNKVLSEFTVSTCVTACIYLN